MGFLKMGIFNQFTGFDFVITVIGLIAWIAYLIKGEDIIISILGQKWKDSIFRSFLAKVLFKGWLFFGGLVLGFFPDWIWVGAWKTVLLLAVLFVVYTKSRKKAKAKASTESGTTATNTATT